MDDDWRLQIDLDDQGIAASLADHLRASELEHELKADLAHRVILSHEGKRIFLYAGTREQIEPARDLVVRVLGEKGWKAELELRRWHPVAEEWEDPDLAEPSTDAERKAERERLMEAEDAETAERGGLAEWEVRAEFPSHQEAREFAEKLRAEGLEPVRRWRYLVIGAADEDAARDLADRISAEAPGDGKVTTEGSLAIRWGERPSNPFAFLGGLAG